ncbi:VOC family protein [Actinoalloteichus caeruleus]|nr:VOC family protein [Actinoalloteichus caeruleus]
MADVDSALARAERLGGTPVLEPVDVPGQGRIAAFSDPEGHVVGLSSG